MSWFKYFCDEIGMNIIVSNCDTRYMMIHFNVINIDNDKFFANLSHIRSNKSL
jgi:hypothetical protein